VENIFNLFNVIQLQTSLKLLHMSKSINLAYAFNNVMDSILYVKTTTIQMKLE
jgi:hypothetical protein